MKNIIIIKQQDKLTIPNAYDRELIKTLKNGQEYEVKIYTKRNIKHLAKYWVLMSALEFQFADNTAEGWHLHYKAKFLPLVEFKFRGQVILYPSSVAFDKMTQTEFDKYYKDVENHLISCGYNIDELINTMGV